MSNRVKTTSTSIGTGNFVVAAGAAAKCLALASVPVGSKKVFMIDNEDSPTEWELVSGTILSGTQFSRDTVINGKNGPGVPTNFTAGTKTVFITTDADKLSLVSDAAFSTSLPLLHVGTARLATKVVTGPLTFTLAAGAVKGAYATFTLRANGVDEPNWGQIAESTGSSGYDNRNGIDNEVTVYYNGTKAYRWIAQDAAATPVVAGDNTGPTLSGATGGSTGTNSANGSVTTNDGTGTLFFIASGNTTETETTLRASAFSKAVLATGSQSVSIPNGLTPSTQYRMHYLQVDPSNNASNIISSAPFTTAAPGDTTAPLLSNPAAVKTGPTSATGSVSTNEATGFLYHYFSPNAVESAPTVVGAALSQPVTAIGVQNVTQAGLTGATTYYPHYVHVDVAGNPSLVATGPSFQTDAGVVYDRMIPNGSTTESGTSPYVYTAIQEAGNLNYGWGANWLKHVAAQTDFSLQFKLVTHVEMWAFTFMASSGAIFASDSINGLVVQFDDNYQSKGGAGTFVSKSLTKPLNGDVVKIERINSAGAAGNTATIKASVSRNGGVFTPLFEITDFPNGEMWPRFHHSGFMAITELQSTGLVA